MNARGAILAIILSASAALGANDVGIEFSGVLTNGDNTQLAVTDKATRATTWVAPGDEFNGYIVDRYDAKRESIFLTKDGQETRIGMVGSKIAEAPVAAAPEKIAPNSPESAAIRANLRVLASTSRIRSNVRSLATGAREYQAKHGVSEVRYADLVGPGKPIKEIKSVAGEDYAGLVFGPNVNDLSVTTSTGETLSFNVATLTQPLPQRPKTSIAASPTRPSSPARPDSQARPDSPVQASATKSPGFAAPAATPAPALAPTGR